MSYHTVLCCICEIKQVSMLQAQTIYEMEQAKGVESFNDFLESIAEWYFDL